MRTICYLEEEIKVLVLYSFKEQYRNTILRELKTDYTKNSIRIFPFNIFLKDRYETIKISDKVRVNKCSYEVKNFVLNKIIRDNINKIDLNALLNCKMELSNDTLDSIKMFMELNK